MLPDFKYLLFAFVVVIFGTKNGRAIFSKYVLGKVLSSILLIPFSIRRRLFLRILSLPPSITKGMLDIASAPHGEQLDWIKKKETSQFTAHWIGPNLASHSLNAIEKQSTAVDLVVMFMHGGGFTVGNSVMYMPSFTYLINQLKNRFRLSSLILSVDYPLTPYPSGLDACVEVYRYLLHDLGIAPSKIILAGDSAGGNLVTTTLLTIRDQRTNDKLKSLPPLPIPAGAITVSPWVNLLTDSPTYKSNHGYDIVTAKQLENHLLRFIPDYKNLLSKSSEEKESFLKQPLLSPLFASFTGLCPFLVTYSDNEVFQYDCLKFIDHLKRDHVDTSSISRKGEVHIWVVEPTIASSIKVWQEDLNKLADWMVERLK